MNTHYLKIALLASALLSSACASTATGKRQSSLMTSSATQQLKTQAPDGSLLAVVRYPAVVDSAAKDKFRQAYMASPIGARVSASATGSVEAENIVDSSIVKSNYFALSLYKELAARLPEHSVLLSPHEIKLGPDGKLTSVPITQAESLPSVVTVDFATYSYPDPKKMMNKNQLTFGDLISPMVTVRTDHRAAVPTHGVLLSSQPLTEAAVGNGYNTAQAALTEMQSGRFSTDVPELDFVSYISKGTRKSTRTASLSLNAPENVVQVTPMEKIRMDGATIASLGKGTKGVADPLKPVFSKGFADRIIDIINDTASEKTAMAKRATAISSYDPSLAALTFVGSDNSDYQARYNYVNRLLDAEKKYLSVQSLRLFDGVHNGEMGAQVRDMLKAEYAILEKRRALAKKQNQATALAFLGAIASGVAIGSQSSKEETQCDRYGRCRTVQRPNYGQQILTDVLVKASIYAGTQAFAYKGQSKAIGNNYLTSIVPALEAQTNVQVSLIDSNETITAIRFDDLKDKLKTLYVEKQRALDTIATRCAYNQDGAASGTWMGVCEGGLANGSGVGVLKNANGSAVEYYGHAQNGLAHGSGYMVVHEAAGSYALEGNFTSGKADGVMRVSKAGNGDQLRTYSAGQDNGSASSSSAVNSPFNTIRTGA